jgi:hypothetical protein
LFLAAGCWSLDSGFSILDACFSILDETGCWLLADGKRKDRRHISYEAGKPGGLKAQKLEVISLHHDASLMILCAHDMRDTVFARTPGRCRG